MATQNNFLKDLEDFIGHWSKKDGSLMDSMDDNVTSTVQLGPNSNFAFLSAKGKVAVFNSLKALAVDIGDNEKMTKCDTPYIMNRNGNRGLLVFTLNIYVNEGGTYKKTSRFVTASFAFEAADDRLTGISNIIIK